jgi:hypothetical protein
MRASCIGSLCCPTGLITKEQSGHEKGTWRLGTRWETCHRGCCVHQSGARVGGLLRLVSKLASMQPAHTHTHTHTCCIPLVVPMRAAGGCLYVFCAACKMSVSNNEKIAARLIRFKQLTGTPETAYHWYQWEQQLFDSRCVFIIALYLPAFTVALHSLRTQNAAPSPTRS